MKETSSVKHNLSCNIREHALISLEALSNKWTDRHTIMAMKKARKSLQRPGCKKACQICISSVNKMFQNMEKVGLDEVMLQIILARLSFQRIKQND